MQVAEPARILLHNVPPSWKGAVWNEMRRPSLRLNILREGGETFVVIHEIGAWNAGLLNPSRVDFVWNEAIGRTWIVV